jgi:phosphatidate cytidylyltransferase
VGSDVAPTATAGATAPAHGTPAAWLKRTLSAALLVPAFVWIVAGAPSWAFPVLVVAVSAAAAWELMRLTGVGALYAALGTVGAAAITAGFAPAAEILLPGYAMLVLTLVVLAVVSAPLWTGTGPATGALGAALLAAVYPGWLLGFAVSLHGRADGAALVLFLTGVTWVGESVAYLVGSAVGRHRLAPRLSPGKTVEGSLAQVLGSVVAAGGLGAWLLPDCAVGLLVLAGALIGAVGQVGDLAESALKRGAGVKDAGGLIPGHGGVLDRVDGLLFNVPVFYYVWTLVGCER